MSQAIVGIFEKPADATRAVDRLFQQGVTDQRVSVMASEPTAEQSLAIQEHSKMAEGAAVGGGFGAATGALIAGLTSVGTLATGGAGLLVAGPMVAALAGAGAGATGGYILGGLVGLGFSEHEVKVFEDALEKGSVIVSVDMTDADDDDKVKDCLEENNASEVTTA